MSELILQAQRCFYQQENSHSTIGVKICVDGPLHYGTQILLQKHLIVVCCFSPALNRKTTPNSRQERNQYCRNQYNTQYLAILSQESSPCYDQPAGSVI